MLNGASTEGLDAKHATMAASPPSLCGTQESLPMSSFVISPIGPPPMSDQLTTPFVVKSKKRLSSSEESMAPAPTPVHIAMQRNVASALHHALHAKTDRHHDQVSHALNGVQICFSQRLWHRREELTGLVESLGGACCWTFDPLQCTHFVHHGTRTDERFKEFKLAKKHEKFIVSPWWIIKVSG